MRIKAEQLDAHRKRQQAQHPKLTMTGMYNVLEQLRAVECKTGWLGSSDSEPPEATGIPSGGSLRSTPATQDRSLTDKEKQGQRTLSRFAE